MLLSRMKKSGRRRRAQFCKARMRVRDAAHDRECQTGESEQSTAVRAMALNFLSKKFWPKAG
jgi:hypothetical protein